MMETLWIVAGDGAFHNKYFQRINLVELMNKKYQYKCFW